MFENSTGEDEINADGIAIPESINRIMQDKKKRQFLVFAFSKPDFNFDCNARLISFTIKGIEYITIQNKLAIILFANFVSYINRKYIRMKVVIMQQKI